MPTKFTLLEPSLEMLKKMVRLATVQFCPHEMDGVEKHRECTHRDGNGTPPYLDYKCGLKNWGSYIVIQQMKEATIVVECHVLISNGKR